MLLDNFFRVLGIRMHFEVCSSTVNCTKNRPFLLNKVDFYKSILHNIFYIICLKSIISQNYHLPLTLYCTNRHSKPPSNFKMVFYSEIISDNCQFVKANQRKVRSIDESPFLFFPTAMFSTFPTGLEDTILLLDFDHFLRSFCARYYGCGCKNHLLKKICFCLD